MGFHIAGFLFPTLILLPNLLFFSYPPKDVQSEKAKAPIWLTILENAGRIICFLYPIVYGTDAAAALISGSMMMYLMAAFILVYYILWARYFVHNRTFAFLFRPLFYLPVPMAVFPAAYFLTLGLLLQSAFMMVAAIAFAISHISISLITYRKLKKSGSLV